MKKREKIAIIGMSAIFPGSETLEKFWENLMQQRDLTGLAGAEDFGVDPQIFFNEKKGVIDRCYSLRGGYIRGFEFDPSGYRLDQDHLKKLDKLYQWALHVSKEALIDGGYHQNADALKKCGVILGNLSFPTASTHRRLASIYTETTASAIQNLLGDETFEIPATRSEVPDNDPLQGDAAQLVKEALGLEIASMDLDAACASSLYAIKLACDDLHSGKADLMLAGAVCGSDQLFIHMGFSIFHAYAPMDQKFIPLDKQSAGLVSSEGAGMILLKRLSDAEKDGDKILGVISGVGLSNDGKGKFLLSPNPRGQALAFQRAYKYSDSQPENTSYLECHATGTPLGDITEMNSIEKFFSKHNCHPLLGSVKSNMGHLLTAAGMSGLFKVLLSMEKNMIPPNARLEQPIASENNWLSREQIIETPTAWNAPKKQAGVNAFGFGGTNAHMVVENYHESEKNESFPNIPLLPMAITGMDAHFGDCAGLDDFLDLIFYGKQNFRTLPPLRWKGFDGNKKLLADHNLTEPPKGGFIEDFEIDLLRYKIQPAEAETLEPQQALILKVADRAIKDAGLKEGQNVAVLIAMNPELAIHNYLARWDSEWQLEDALEKLSPPLEDDDKASLIAKCKNLLYHREGAQTPSQHTSFVGNIMASRIAALWDFTGPAFTITNGDDSVIRAIEVAQNMLSNGEVEAVVVGGVEFAGGLESVLLKSKKHPLNSAQNPSLSFEQQNSGWMIGEGAGVIVLKNQNKVSEKEKTYAVVENIGNLPTPQAVDYRELFASGIETEDRRELEKLLKNNSDEPVALGAIKANIGHTFAASAMASIIKTALCLHYKFIPAVPNWNAPKQQDAFEHTGYYFPQKSQPWLKKGTPRKAAVHSHDDVQLLLAESATTPPLKVSSLLHKSGPKLIPLKGNSEKELLTKLKALEIALENETGFDDTARRFYEKSKELNTDFCIALIGKSKPAMLREIAFLKSNLQKAFESGKVLETPSGSYFNPKPTAKEGALAFVYPGSATAYEGIGSDLFQLFPDLLPFYEKLTGSVDKFLWPDYLYPKRKSASEIHPAIQSDAIAMMSVGVFFSTVFTRILREYFQIKPKAAFGYSMGECSSMWYSLGVWNHENATIFQNSPIFKNRFSGNLELLAETWNISSEEAKSRWVSLALLADSQKVTPLVDGRKNVFLSFINSEKEVIISGDRKACFDIAEQLGCTFVEMPFQNIIHHEFCRAEYDGLLEMHHFNLQEKPPIDFYSSISKNKIPFDSKVIAENSTQVWCEKVDIPTTFNAVFSEGINTFVEVGVNSTCSNWIKDILKEKNHLAVSVDKKGAGTAQTIVECIGKLISNGFDANLEILYPETETDTQQRHFMKKIIPGGLRIYDELLSETMRSKYYRKKSQKVLAAAVASEVGFSTKNLQTKKQIPSSPTLPSISNMNKNIENTVIATPVKKSLAENGLKLQDYSSPDHLAEKNIVFSQEDLVEFATGKIANVFGEAYAIIDSYRRRVMLPMDPYLLVSRVTGLNAKLGEYKPSTIQTEYDIPYNAWFTTDGQIPWAVSVESGQCDLMLISYLGIDFQNKGDYVYRLLDCTLTFLDDLPFEGQTLRYDISINSFVRNGNNLLFFFSYECFVEDRMILKMDGGCAGFFTDEQLESGHGVIYTDDEIRKLQNIEKQIFTPLLNTHKTSFSTEDLQHLTNGDIHLCFENEGYFANGRNPSLRLPDEKIRMFDRITSVDLHGGAYGLGEIIAEKDLAPEDWYFPCHFRDDEVLAGSLQAEGGGNLLRFFMLMLGLQRLTKDARFQPVFDLPQKVRCRKQVIPEKDTKLIYRLVIKEIGLTPDPYVIGDLEIISNDVITVHFENLGLQLREKSNPRYLELQNKPNAKIDTREVLLDHKAISTFALGRLSDCFGEDFAVYDNRKVSRQPNTDLQLISRVLRIEGERGNFKQPSTIYAEYDVPADAWYYHQNASPTMPYSILMEIALQPCGLLGAYLGSTLQYPDQNLYFRNLDGEGEMFDLPNGTDLRGKTIANKCVLVSSVSLGGTIIQKYTFELSVDGNVFYKGNSSFGFFPKEALAQQIGLDNGTEVAPWFETKGLAPKDYFQFRLDSLYAKMKLYKGAAEHPQFHLAADQLDLLHKGLIIKNGGQFEKGYIHATKFMKPYDWFFTCHFYQDPVMPGSLGIEAILQAMQIFAMQQNLADGFRSPRFEQVDHHKTVWKYRGQILLPVKEMHLEVHFKNIAQKDDKLVLVGDAYLWNEKTRIYQVTDLALGIEETKG